ncbi:MAG: PD-(D/E)XK nuclease domain-containing protein [Spirochaetota bacterium]
MLLEFPEGLEFPQGQMLRACPGNGVWPTKERNSCLVLRFNFSKIEVRSSYELEGSLPASVEQVASKFSMSRFLDPTFLPAALFYLGQLTYNGEFALGFPNLTVKKIFIGYYDELHRLDVVVLLAPLFQRFAENGDWSALFAGYWEHYIRSIPAQTFDKANENFYRSTFFALCSRYLQRYFVFNAELNLPSGRADLVAYGRAGEIFAKQLVLFEFKHLSRERARREDLSSWTEGRPEDAAQADRCIGELLPVHQGRSCSRHLVYSSGNAEYRFFKSVTTPLSSTKPQSQRRRIDAGCISQSCWN